MPSEGNHFLVINCGSSSLKYALYDYQPAHSDDTKLSLVSEGLAEALGSKQARITIDLLAPKEERIRSECSNHASAIELILNTLEPSYQLSQTLCGVGHRVVHGGEHFKESTLINDNVCSQIKACIPLAPLHNPANLDGIELLKERFPNTPQVAVFDTAFHQSMPSHAYIYALPYGLYKQLGVRRYGFHGSSHRYVSQRAANDLSLENGGNFITAHLGNGASVCAIRNGQSVDTSMGMTPLEGLVMGTRSGDIDPGIFDFLLSKGYEPENINQMLNKESGLKGISKLSNDMRTLVASADEGHELSQLAIEIFCYRLAKYIGAMMVALEQIDALIFTGGIGENASLVREKTVSHLKLLGFIINKTANEARPSPDHLLCISTDDSHRILVINTDEEKMIAEDTQNIVNCLK